MGQEFLKQSGSAPDRVYIGKPVHFVLDSGDVPGECRPAVIVDMEKSSGTPAPTTVDLIVFTRPLRDGYGDRTGLDHKEAIAYDSELTQGTWHLEHWSEDP